MKIAPSILSADFARLGQQVVEAAEAGADYLHVDVMDGHFVPALTFGPLVIAAIRPLVRIPLDVHLMITAPERYLKEFADAGADILTVHVEATGHLHRTLETIHALGKRAGAAVNPGTPLAALEEALHQLDLVNIGTVDPGFAGQPFIQAMLPKIARMRRLLDEGGYGAELEIDGGANVQTAPPAVAAGARVLVAGSAIFNQHGSVADNLHRLRDSLSGFSPGSQ
ncbi:MAG: ribulose-phosphate 3-epimerase [Chloroflexi bacterium]|nr:ribulose-phosphate 3-epimerase [Chloroflexota bacterium]